MRRRSRKARRADNRTPPTPVRKSLRPESPLLKEVSDGLGALAAGHRACVHPEIRNEFRDSIDLDTALRAGRESEHRWDYLIGHGPSSRVVAVEPHSAKDDELQTVIRKKEAARAQLAAHFRPGASVAVWIWVASGRVKFADTEKTRRILDQHGIRFASKELAAHHLPGG